MALESKDRSVVIWSTDALVSSSLREIVKESKAGAAYKIYQPSLNLIIIKRFVEIERRVGGSEEADDFGNGTE